jgi:Domain of unknown function (DUF1835)
MDSLIITNGDDAVALMREAGIRGEILPWRDILHEGPVPPSLPLEDLSAVRADFLAQRGWLPKEELHAAFRSRDAMIRRHSEFESVVLWFEHDLYDQLQLMQLLDFFATERREGLYLIQAGRYLGLEKPKALKTHFHLMEPVTDAQLALARLAWNGFRAPTPELWAGLLRGSTRILPFLRLALLRLLEELPHPASGLSRTEATILSLVSGGVKKPPELYEAFTHSEEVFFMGDLSFYHALDGLGEGGSPLIAGFKGLTFSPSMPEEERNAYLAAELSCTHLGVTVLSGKSDALQHRPLDRHIGGYWLHSGAPWRWNSENGCLLPPHA